MAAVEVPQTLEYWTFKIILMNAEDDKEHSEYLNEPDIYSTKSTDQTECHKCAKKGHFTRDCWSKTSVSTYQSPFQPKPLSSPQHKPELRPTKDFEVKYNKVKAKLALLSLNASASKALCEQIPSQKKRIMGVDQLIEDPSSLGKKDLVFVKSSADDTKVTIPGVERPWLSEAEGFILPNYDTGMILLSIDTKRDTTDPSVAVTDSSMTDYDSADKSSVCSTPLPPLKKSLLKGSLINEPSLAPAKGNKSSSALKVHSAPADKLKCVKIKDDPPLASVMKELNSLKLQVSKNQSSYSRISSGLALYKEEINLRNPQHAFKRYEAYGSSNHTITDHYDIEWFRRGEALQAKKAEALKSTRAKSSKANRSKTPTKRWVSKRN
ncbi:retrovirus-related pol polyprotein from transposon TNT 1-94 [Tanacetum coccineum]